MCQLRNLFITLFWFVTPNLEVRTGQCEADGIAKGTHSDCDSVAFGVCGGNGMIDAKNGLCSELNRKFGFKK